MTTASDIVSDLFLTQFQLVDHMNDIVHIVNDILAVSHLMAPATGAINPR
jgi:hypothetical protein